MIFDVAVLEKTELSKTLLRDQLYPMLQSKSSTKVTYDADIKTSRGSGEGISSSILSSIEIQQP